MSTQPLFPVILVGVVRISLRALSVMDLSGIVRYPSVSEPSGEAKGSGVGLVRWFGVFLIHYYSQCALPSVCQWWERGVEPQHVPPPHNRFSKFFAHISIGALEGSSNTNAKYV